MPFDDAQPADNPAHGGVMERAVAWPSPQNARAVLEGLSKADLEQLARRMAPTDRSLKYRIVPRASLARRKDGRLSSAESERLMRVARLYDYAVKCFKDEDRARHFFFGPHMLMDMEWPIDLVISGETGARVVEETLSRMYYGLGV